MAHDPLLEKRLADALAGQGVKAEPKRMFGGVAFMVRGHMAVGVTNKSQLMVRFAPDRHEEILGWPGALPMTYGKGDMRGFLFVDPEVIKDGREMVQWVKLALEHVGTLPAKPLKKPKASSAAKSASAPTAKKAPVGLLSQK